jgi:hypothetical protein
MSVSNGPYNKPADQLPARSLGQAEMRLAHRDDIPTLLSLMSEFYAESGYKLDHALAERAFVSIVSDERLGFVWLIDEETKNVGYVVLTLKLGMDMAV